MKYFLKLARGHLKIEKQKAKAVFFICLRLYKKKEKGKKEENKTQKNICLPKARQEIHKKDRPVYLLLKQTDYGGESFFMRQLLFVQGNS